MARLASQMKGGYYPTPTDEFQHIIQSLSFTYTDKASTLNLIDPCCGTGTVVHRFGNHLKTQIKKFEVEATVSTFGVELEEGRANEAGAVLDHVLCESYEAVRTESKYGLLWLNPPYDNFDGDRLENRFLRKLTSNSNSLLQPKGLLMFCIPQAVLKDTAVTLAKRFTDIKVYRFTDAHFDEFEQVVVFGYYKKQAVKGERDVAKELRRLAEVDPSEIPTLEEIDEVYFVPASEEAVQTFRAGKFRPDEIAKDLMDSPLTTDFFGRVTVKESRAIMKRPILPLKATHAGIAVASGAIGGNLGTHIVSGITKETTHTEPLTDKEGRHTGDKVSKFYSSVVRAYTPNGVFELD